MSQNQLVAITALKEAREYLEKTVAIGLPATLAIQHLAVAVEALAKENEALLKAITELSEQSQ